MRAVFILFLLIFGPLSFCQPGIQSYEYWFDDYFESRQIHAVNPGSQLVLNTDVSTGSLSNGLHILHIRFKDDSARFSGTHSRFFYKDHSGVAAVNKVKALQYWFDDQVEGAVRQAINPGENIVLNTLIPTAGMPDGLHTLHIRFLDEFNFWSSTKSQFIYKLSQRVLTDSNKISGYQYWFDQRFDEASFFPVNVSGVLQLSSAIPTGQLSQGVHLFHLRFRDANLRWSSPVSYFVYVAKASGTPMLEKMQYWFDQDFNQAITRPLSSAAEVEVAEGLLTDSLTIGLHKIQLRFADTSGHWSSTQSHFFYKGPENQITNNVITGYRYWLNDDFDQATTHAVSNKQMFTWNDTLDLGCLTGGNNQIHVQFSDIKQFWSSVLTDTIAVSVSAGYIYRFTGNGHWSEASNWLNNAKPTTDLPFCKEIIIDHVAGGVCILDVPQHILKNAKLTVLPGKHLVLPDDVEIK